MFKHLPRLTISRRRSGALAAVIVMLGFASPAAAEQPPTEVSAGDAGEILEAATATIAPAAAPQSAEPALDATIALRDLAAAYPALPASARRGAHALLASPPTDSADRFGDGYPQGAPIATAASPHFCFYWVTAQLSRRPGPADRTGSPTATESRTTSRH